MAIRNSSLSLFNHSEELFEYHLRIVPQEPCYSDVEVLKLNFEQRFGKTKYVRSKPHITIFDTKIYKEREQKLISQLGQALETSAFNVQVIGIEGFLFNHVIYLNVAPNGVLQNQAQRLKELFYAKLKLKKSSVMIIDKFHMTIAVADNSEQYQEAMQHLSGLEVKFEFPVQKFYLLKRKVGPFVSWTNCHEYVLHEEDKAQVKP